MRFVAPAIVALLIAVPQVHAQDDQPEESGDSAAITSIKLQHASADNVARILSDQFPIKFSSNQDTNTIYARIETLVPALQENVHKLVAQLEQDAQENADKLQRVQDQADAPRGESRKQEVESVLARLGNRLDRATRLSELDVQSDLVPLIIRLAQTTAQYGADHPKVEEIRQQIDEAREQISDIVETRIRDLRESDPFRTEASTKYGAIESEVKEVLRQWRGQEPSQIPEEDKAKIRDGITEQIGKLFDLRQEVEERDLQDAQQQLDKIRRRLEQRKQNREQIVKQRVEELLAGDK